MNASIISIGDELLIGQVINTNATWMSEQLTLIGLDVDQVITIADDAKAIKQSIIHSESDVILITGGLGPTKDDITKKTLAELWGVKLVTNPEALAQLTHYFKVREWPLTPTNAAQALVPEGCTTFVNKVGTASTMMLCNEKNQLVISMPGVPHEMKWMMTHHILPELKYRFQLPAIYYKTILTFGIGESTLSDLIEPWELQLPKHIRLAYLPEAGKVRLRLTAHGDATGENNAALEKDVQDEINKVMPLIEDFVYGYNQDNCALSIGKLLVDRHETLGTAESCTGGLLSYQLTSNAGSSAYFQGGIITYSNEAKHALLGVKERTLTEYGAVSKETAQEMALGAIKALHTDWAIATTGISGPTGETPTKPLGTVWIAIANKNGETRTEKYIFQSTRNQHQERSANQSLFNLYEWLKLAK